MSRIPSFAAYKESLLVISILLTASSFLGCRSEDLGDKSPDQIALTDGSATWDGGVGAVIRQKCANCHTAKRSQFVPANTPHVLDGIENEAFFADDANLTLIKAMAHRVAEGSEGRMPPKFATPLMPEEKTALSQFLDNRIAALSQDSDDTVAACATEEDRVKAFESLLQDNCARCHASPPKKPGRPPLTNYDEWLAIQDRAMEIILTGKMPPRNPDFQNTTAGKKLLGTLDVCEDTGEPN